MLSISVYLRPHLCICIALTSLIRVLHPEAPVSHKQFDNETQDQHDQQDLPVHKEMEPGGGRACPEQLSRSAAPLWWTYGCRKTRMQRIDQGSVMPPSRIHDTKLGSTLSWGLASLVDMRPRRAPRPCVYMPSASRHASEAWQNPKTCSFRA